MAKIFFLFIFYALKLNYFSQANENNTSIANETNTSVDFTSCDVVGVEDDFNCNITRICILRDTFLLPEWMKQENNQSNVLDQSPSAALTNVTFTWENDALNGSYYYFLHISWNFDDCVRANSNLTRGFLVNIVNQNPGGPESDDCYFLDFHSSFFYQSDSPTFRLRPLVYRGVSYTINIISLPSKVTRKYDVTIPEPPAAMLTYQNQLDNWKTVLAVSIYKCGDADVFMKSMVFDPAPRHLKPLYYTISGQFSSRNVSLDEAEGSFLSSVNSIDNSYHFTLTVYGEEQCPAPAGCVVAEVSVIYATSPPETMPPSLSSVTSAGVLPTDTSKTESGHKDVTTTSVSPHSGSDTNIGLIVGVIVGVLIVMAIVIGLCCAYNNRHKRDDPAYQMQRLNNDMDPDSKLPSVLILYSYDCPAHEQVVIEFANFVKNEWHLDVHLDLWQQKDILERGDIQWLNEKLIVSQFVIIISSTGARYKCARNRQFRMKYDRSVPDMFTYAVDLVLERCRASKLEISAHGNNVNAPPHPSLECLVVMFNYSCANDVPPKLDTHPRFVLIKDLYELHCHLERIKPLDKPPSNFNAVSTTRYKSTKSGKQFHMVLTKASDFFQKNPDWLGEILEPISPPHITNEQEQQKSKKQGQSDSQPDPNVHFTKNMDGQVMEGNDNEENSSNSLTKNQNSSISHSRMSSNISATEEDALLEERKKKRLKEEESKIERIPSSNKLKDMVSFNNSGLNGTTAINMHPLGGDGVNGNNHVPNNSFSDKTSVHSGSRTHSRNNSDYSSLNRSCGNNNNKSPYVNGVPPDTKTLDNLDTGTVPVLSNQVKDSSKNNGPSENGVVSHEDVYDKSLEEIDAEQLQKDIDFIHNNYYDLHNEWDIPTDHRDVLIDMDFTGYTPPENVPLSQTYKHFSQYDQKFRHNNYRNELMNNFQGANLDFTNPTYLKMNGDINLESHKQEVNEDFLLLNGFRPAKMQKSDKNDNFIIDFEIPQEKLNDLKSRSANSFKLKESTSNGTRL